ncbi:CRE-SRG-10 protein [Aphelenchoides avenae]|nr:CRE-SRG-10 protein [Aphelenchus avenae]
MSTPSPSSVPTDHPYSPWRTANLKVLIPLVYGLPLLVLYLLVVAVILSRLRGPFYKLFAVAGIADIISWVLTFTLRRAKTAPIFFGFYESLPRKGNFVTFVVFAYYYNLYAQFFAAFFLTASRFTAAVLPLGHRKLWTWLIRVSYVVIAFLPLPLTWTVWLCEVKIFYENPKNYWDGYRWDMTVDAFGINRSVVSGSIGLSNLFCVLCMNFTVFVKMCQIRRQIGTITDAKDDKRDSELKLILLTVVLTLYSLVIVIIEVIFYIAKAKLTPTDVSILFNAQSLALDVHVLSAPIFLLFMSTAARQELFAFLGIKRARLASLHGGQSERGRSGTPVAKTHEWVRCQLYSRNRFETTGSD